MTDLDEEDQLTMESGPFSLNIPNLTHRVKIKCTPCTVVTVHDWLSVEPYWPKLEALEMLPLSRRIIMCTECGNLSLKK